MPFGFSAQFVALAASRTVSILGSEMSRFALPIWIFQNGGGATGIGFATAAGYLPQIIMGPFAGVLIDRTDRKPLLIMCDIALAAISVLLLLATTLEGEARWGALFILLIAAGACSSLQYPALQVVTADFNPGMLARANGLISISESSAGMLSPLLAAGFLALFGIKGVILIDAATFVACALVTALIRFPRITQSGSKPLRPREWAEQSRQGFTEIMRVPVLRSAMLLTCSTNFFLSFGFIVITPLILGPSGTGTDTLALLMALGALSQAATAFACSAWTFGRADIILPRGTAIAGLGGLCVIGLGSNPIVWCVGLIIASGCLPVVNTYNRALWQSRVPSHIQGRVFAARRSISLLLAPLGYATAGAIGERFLEPLLSPPPGMGYRACLILAGASMAAFAIIADIRGTLRHDA